jgi:hypothetical protein
MSTFKTWRCDGPLCGREVRGEQQPQHWQAWEAARIYYDFCARRCLVEFMDRFYEMPGFPASPDPER